MVYFQINDFQSLSIVKNLNEELTSLKEFYGSNFEIIKKSNRITLAINPKQKQLIIEIPNLNRNKLIPILKNQKDIEWAGDSAMYPLEYYNIDNKLDSYYNIIEPMLDIQEKTIVNDFLN